SSACQREPASSVIALRGSAGAVLVGSPPAHAASRRIAAVARSCIGMSPEPTRRPARCFDRVQSIRVKPRSVAQRRLVRHAEARVAEARQAVLRTGDVETQRDQRAPVSSDRPRPAARRPCQRWFARPCSPGAAFRAGNASGRSTQDDDRQSAAARYVPSSCEPSAPALCGPKIDERPMTEPGRLVMIGIDAGDLRLIREMLDELPRLRALFADAELSELTSPADVLTSAVWPTFATGQPPG